MYFLGKDYAIKWQITGKDARITEERRVMIYTDECETTLLCDKKVLPRFYKSPITEHLFRGRQLREYGMQMK